MYNNNKKSIGKVLPWIACEMWNVCISCIYNFILFFHQTFTTTTIDVSPYWMFQFIVCTFAQYLNTCEPSMFSLFFLFANTFPHFTFSLFKNRNYNLEWIRMFGIWIYRICYIWLKGFYSKYQFLLKIFFSGIFSPNCSTIKSTFVCKLNRTHDWMGFFASWESFFV